MEDRFSMQVLKATTDEWYTPRECVNLIIPYLVGGGYHKILCPFDKEESLFVQVLRENGFDVTYSHIDTGTDFFDIDNLSDYDAVVSNPPFSKRGEVLKRLFESKVPFALISNFNGLFDSRERWGLFKENKFELLIPSGRMRFFNDRGMANSPNFQSLYVCSGILPNQIEFVKFK